MSEQPTVAEIVDQIRRNFADWALASAPIVARFNRAIEALGSHAIEALEALGERDRLSAMRTEYRRKTRGRR